MFFELHCHSRYSIDALTKPETIIKICKKNNYGISVTDHNNMDIYKKSSILKLAKKEGVFLIPGEEIKVIENINGKEKCVGEIIGYFMSEEIAPSSFEEIYEKLKEQDAILSCPHPFDWPRKNFTNFGKEWKKFSSMEIYNARAYYNKLNEHSKKFYETIANKKIAPLGVSDAHTPEEIGNGLTEINATNENEFRKEIKKFRTKPIIKGKANVWHHFQTQMARKRWMSER